MVEGFQRCTRSGGWVRYLPEHVVKARQLEKENAKLKEDLAQTKQTVEELRQLVLESLSSKTKKSKTEG